MWATYISMILDLINGMLFRAIFNENAENLPLSWWRHHMETFSALLAICAGNSPVPGEFPAQRPVMRGFDVFFDLHPNKRLSKQLWGWWFETPSCPLWRHRKVFLRIWKGRMIPRCHLCNVQMRQLMHWILKCPLWSSPIEFEWKYYKLPKLMSCKTALLIRAITI